MRFFFRILKHCPFFRISTFKRPLPTTTTMDSPVHTHPRRKRGAEVSLDIHYAMAVEIALAIPPGNSNVPGGILRPLADRYGVGPEHPTKLWQNCKAQIDEIGELDLSNKPRSGRPSRLTPAKAAALRTVNKQNRSFTLRQVSDQLREIGLDYGSSTVQTGVA